LAGKAKLILCPYCGNTQSEPKDRCATCGGFFDPLSLKVTQQAMGPWFVHDRANPFRPGCSYDVLLGQIEKGKLTANTVLRGPTTRQFWSVARNVPGVSHLVGYCHTCGSHVQKTDDVCTQCGAIFFAPRLRDQLGLAPMVSDQPGKRYETEPTAGAGSGIASTENTNGSQILRDLRGSEVSASEMPATATPQTPPDLPPADEPHDAMDWMTSTDATASDDLAPAGRSLYELQAKSKGRGVGTWVLVATNLLLVAAIVVVIVFVVVPRLLNPPTPPADRQPDTPTTASTPDPDDPFSIIRIQPSDDLPERTLRPPAPPEPPEPIDTTPDPGSLYQRLYSQALEAERIGELNEAARLLNQIAVNAPARERPADLRTTMDRVRRKLERRELEQMFGPAMPETTPAPPTGTTPLPVNPLPPEPVNTGPTTIFDEVPTASDGDRQALSWQNRFNEALELEKQGDVEGALGILADIRRNAPREQRPEGLNEAFRRVVVKAGQRVGGDSPQRVPR
jgi:hypothetical protein